MSNYLDSVFAVFALRYPGVASLLVCNLPARNL